MAYDKKTHTISVGNESDFLMDLGVAYINELKMDSQEDSASSTLVNDWKIIERWLGCSGRELNTKDSEKISKAWRAYIAIGLAPSDKSQPIFSSFSEKYKQQGLSYISDKPPTEVLDVFDRLIATD